MSASVRENEERFSASGDGWLRVDSRHQENIRHRYSTMSAGDPTAVIRENSRRPF